VVLFSNISMSSGSACSSDGSKKGPGAPRHPVWDHFELTDRNKSNRYTANCNFCNIAFPDARLDNIKKHILAECKDVPSEVRSTVQDEISKEDLEGHRPESFTEMLQSSRSYFMAEEFDPSYKPAYHPPVVPSTLGNLGGVARVDAASLVESMFPSH